MSNGVHLAAVALLAAAFPWASGADKKPAAGRASNSVAEITATVFLDREQVRRVVGAELEHTIAVAEVRLSPRPGVKLKVVRDDFELWSGKNGGRSTPFAPTQIAGRAVLGVRNRGGGAGVASQNDGRVWRSPTGDGRPRRIGGEGASVGNVSGVEENAVQASRDGGAKDTLALLEEKVLPEKELDGPLTGLLYFYLEGRHSEGCDAALPDASGQAGGAIQRVSRRAARAARGLTPPG